jgi:alpha-beta hydrolase superfamily lysophospholipase
VLVIHGSEDRIAAPTRSAELARRIARTTEVGYISVPGARHAMLRQGARFETYAAEFVAATLLGRPARSDAVSAVLHGTAYVEG